MDLRRSVSQLVYLSLFCLFGTLFRSPLSLAQQGQYRGVTIHRSGGYSGIEEEWYFSEVGTRWTEDGPSVQTPIRKLERLRQLVARNVKKAQSPVPLLSVCCDCFTFRITVWYDDGHQTLELAELTGKPEGDVLELLGVIRDLTRDHPLKP